MRRERGMATLATVSGILLLIALFASAVALSGYAEIKKAQNAVVDAVQRASAKAGLDCAIARFERLKPDPDKAGFESLLASGCQTATQAEIQVIEVDEGWVVSSSKGYSTAKALIALAEIEEAAFKTSGSLLIKGGNSWVPAKGPLLDDSSGISEYACTAIIAGGSVTIDVGTSAAGFKTYLPASNEVCEEDQFSTVVNPGAGVVSDGFESDILAYQANVDIFYEVFGKDKAEWASVKNEMGFYTVKTGSAIRQRSEVEQCGETLQGAMEAGHTLIWVTGDCLLNGLNDVRPGESSPIIVVQNGVVGASTPIDGFNGTILQFTDNSSTANFLESWGASSKEGVGQCLPGAMSALCAQLINERKGDTNFWANLPFYFYGAFTSNGAYLVDIPGSTALINGAFSPRFDGSAFEHTVRSKQPRLVKGSIHDF